MLDKIGVHGRHTGAADGMAFQAQSLVSLIESAIRAVRTLARTKSVRIVVKGLSPKDEARGQSVMGDEVNILSNISASFYCFFFTFFLSILLFSFLSNSF